MPGAFEDGVDACAFEKLPIVFRHAERAGRLSPHHRDPFDRMLVAQAIEEKLTLVSADRQFDRYHVPLLWAGSRAP